MDIWLLIFMGFVGWILGNKIEKIEREVDDISYRLDEIHEVVRPYDHLDD